MTPFILLLLGLIAIFIEFYLPGGIMAILGAIALIASIVVFAEQSNSLIATVLFIIGVAGLLFLLIKFTMKLIVRSKSQYSIYLNEDQQGYRASKFDENAIGKTGVVISDLKPGGYILIEGKRQQANSVEGYLPKGTEVVVLRGEEESLIVRKK